MNKSLQVHFTAEEKKKLARAAIELDKSMAAIVRQAVSEFLARQSVETNAGDSSVSQAAHTPAQQQELPT